MKGAYDPVLAIIGITLMCIGVALAMTKRWLVLGAIVGCAGISVFFGFAWEDSP